MKTFERTTLVISSLALVVSLLAAAISPWVTYHWFDPATKPFKERAIFVRIHSDVTEPADNSHTGLSAEVNAEIQVQNIGHYPANNPKIVAITRAPQDAAPTISIADRLAERTKASGNVFEYTLSQPIAPDASITIIAHGSIGGLYLFTEYGDKAVLYESNPFDGFR